jgi:hypothetical protein
MKLGIFSCHHAVPTYAVRSDIFKTIVTNVQPDPDERYITDLSGINIATKLNYCELRQQYFVWKNIIHKYDYVGFEHYRRPFLIDPLPAETMLNCFPTLYPIRKASLSNSLDWNVKISTEQFYSYTKMRESFDAQTCISVQNHIYHFDMVVTRPTHGEPISHQWKRSHAPEYWDPLMAAINDCEYFKTHSRLFDDEQISKHYLNMYILKREYFIEYMQIWHDVMQRLETEFPQPDERIFGFLSERLFSMYVYQKRLENPLIRIREMPHLLAEALHIPAQAAPPFIEPGEIIMGGGDAGGGDRRP